MKHSSKALKSFTRNLIVFGAIFLFCKPGLAQTSISGPSCISTGVQYSYVLSCYSSGFSYVVVGGTIYPSGSSGSHAAGTVTLLITWNSGITTGSITLYGGPGANLNVSVLSVPLSGGIYTSGNAQSLNYGATPASIVCAAASGGSCTAPSYTYQWQQSTDNVTFTNITGAMSLNLSFSTGLTQTMYYRRLVSEATSGNTAYTAVATMFVYPQVVAGTVTPATQTINYNTNAALLSSSGVSGGTNSYTYQWQSSPNNTTWTDISGAISTTYTPTSLTATTYYRVVVNSNGASANSSSALVTVYPQVVSGTVSPLTQNINYNTAPASIAVTAATGGTGTYTYQWYGSPNNTTWTLISGATVTNYAPPSLTASTYYHVVATSNGATATSASAFVNVYPQLVAGSVSPASATINYSTSPGLLTLSGVSGGSGTYAYQWYSSPDNITWTLISGATASTYTPGNLTSSIYYRTGVTSNSLTLYSSSTYITVYPLLVPGSISPASQTINFNTVPSSLSVTGTSGGSGTFTYQWNVSFDNTYWAPIDGATLSTYAPPILSASTYYNLSVSSNGVSFNTASTLITVNPQVIPGAIVPAYLPITTGTSPGAITGTPASGGACGGSYTYQWQSSTNGLTFTNITGATSQNYTPGVLTVKTWFQRKVTCGTDNEYTNTSVVAIASGIVDMNYIRVRNILKAGVTDSTTAVGLTSPYDVAQTTQYFDGLGRSVQTVAKQQSPLQNDMVSVNVYDGFGRESNKYLPYTSNTTDGNYKITALTDEYNFNVVQFPNETYYYGQTNFESSPLNRALISMSPGANWTGLGKGIIGQYLINNVSDSVRLWTISRVRGSLPNTVATYAPGTLYKNVTVDENNNQVAEYKDLDGHTVLKKVQAIPAPGSAHVGWSCTYYIYDSLGNIRFVIQPNAVQAINGSWTVTTAIANELCFRYEYDQRNRMTIKKVPGVGEAWMVYDARDRLVMTQDSALRKNKQFLFTRFDMENRPDSTGLITDLTNYANLNFHLGQAYASVNYPVVASYTNELLTQSYYDDYLWITGTGSGLTSIMPTMPSTDFITSFNTWPIYAVQNIPHYITRGMVTGSMAKVIGTASQYLYGVNFYDDRARVILNQSVNFTGAIDTVTNQYNFSGKALRNILNHKKAGNTSQNHLVMTKMDYDQAFRLKHIYKNIDNAATDQLIDSMQYNELGQLSSKCLGTSLDSLIYDYNIRGWLTGINKVLVAANANHFFGLELAYDKTTSVSSATYTTAQYNGNIAGLIWKSAGDQIDRKYDFVYDNLNRLTSANFVQNTNGSTWDNGYINYSVGNIKYDPNGNIQSMNQYGFKVGGSSPIDQLTYIYQANSNKLSQITDASNDANSKLGDFHYTGTKGSSDYNYEGNGSLITDNNKGIDNITYNYLNLPQLVHINGKGNITYTYDAAGNKLKKVTADSTNRHSTTTLYLGSLVYQQTDTITNQGGGIDTLQFISHEEGRARWAWHKYFTLGTTGYNFEYDFYEKDHLGNNRILLTQQKDSTKYIATMESAYRSTESQLFGNIATTSYKRSLVPSYPNDISVTNPNDNVSRLNGNPSLGQKIGPNLLLKVMSGDKIDLSVQYYFNTGTTSAPNSYANDVLNSLATGIVNMTAGGHGSLADLNNTSTSPIYAAINTFIAANDATPPSKPKAYLNWILLDDQFKYVNSYPQSGALPVVTAGPNGTSLQSPLGYAGIPITKSGYMYIWVSNETPGWDVFFDNLSVKQYTGPLLEETHYYPFGLTMAGISDKAIKTNYTENNYKFNGKELDNREFTDGSGLDWYEYGMREYDPQIGRFFRIDPLSEKFYQLTPFQYASNDPISNIDLDGLEGTGAVSGSASKDQKQNNPQDLNKQTWGTMTIKTNVGTDGGAIDGHAWLEFTRVDGQATTLSLWGNQGDQEFFANKEIGQDAVTSRTVTITNGDIDKINSFNSNADNVDWTCTNTCAGYSSRLWNTVTGEQLDASNWLGFTTPTKLAGSIVDQNGGTASNLPNGAPADNNSGSNGNSSSSSGSGSGSSLSNSSFTNSGSSRPSNSSSGSSTSNSSFSAASSGGAAKQTNQQLNASNNATKLRKIYNPNKR